MRICHVTPHLPPDLGANALLPAELGAWARARGDDAVFVAHPAAQGGAAAAVRGVAGSQDPMAASVRWVPRRERTSGLSRALRLDSLGQAREITAALDAVAARADLLHLHSNGLIVEAAARWATQRRKPYVLTLYGTEVWHYRARWPIDLFTRAYRGAGAVTFYSQRLLDRARELGLDRSRLQVIYPAVAEAFAPQDAPTRRQWKAELGIAEPIVLLNVKRLHELAGQRFLLDAFARLARTRDDVRLVICGTGPLRAALDTQARELGIAARVTFTGLLANTDIARYAAVADLFVLPSLLEALPTVAVEALGAGTPVLSADHPGGLELHEIFGDDVEVVPRGNVDRLTEALTAALSGLRRTTAATEAKVRERFRRPAVEAAYWEVYAGAAPDASPA